MGKETFGELEHQVLLAAVRLGREAYSASIVTELERVTARSVSPAAVYISLRRLEENGLALSTLRLADGRNQGRERRYFEPTPEGLRLLGESRRRFVNLWDGIESVIEGGAG